MAVELNHTIVWSTDQARSAAFLCEMFGRPEPARFAHFHVVEMDNGVSLDFAETQAVHPQHYAFLVSDEEFDAIHQRILERGLDHWADPNLTKPGEINHRFGGRGVYFKDPDGHLLEALTAPYSA